MKNTNVAASPMGYAARRSDLNDEGIYAAADFTCCSAAETSFKSGTTGMS
jgi:hypothetical protein